MTKHTIVAAAHIGAAIIFCISGVLGSVKLIEISLVGEKTFFALIFLSVAVSVLIAFFWALKDFIISGGSLKATLRETKEVESSVKNLASAMLELTEASEGSLKVSTCDDVRYEQAKKKLASLVE
jgi:hypothetical protein